LIISLKNKKFYINMNVVGQIYERPWGTYRTIEQRENYQLKHIVVKPGKRLSLQYHHHRDEHWTVIKGKGTVQLDEKSIDLELNGRVFIPKLSKHRMSNNTQEDVEFLEIQIGDYLGEDDIVRVEDDFGRN
tara:strand:+ start:135 stop:527 length:393 start_codon:yes stop_codon:yes gene_type:complete